MLEKQSNKSTASQVEMGRTVKLLVFKIVDGKILVFLVKSAKYWSLPGGKGLYNETPHETLIREVMEETDMTFFNINNADPLLEGGHVKVYGLRVSQNYQVKHRGEILESVWATTDVVEHLTNRFWKKAVLDSYIHWYRSNIEYNDVVEAQEDEREALDDYLEERKKMIRDMEDAVDEWCDEQDVDEDPCFDCDDSKMPYAERGCSECKHGGKEKPLTKEQKQKLDTDEDANYRLDMWGPDSI